MTSVRLSKKIEFGPKSRTKPGAKTWASEPPPLRFPPVFRLRRSWRHEQGPARAPHDRSAVLRERRFRWPNRRTDIRAADCHPSDELQRGAGSSSAGVPRNMFRLRNSRFHHQKENTFEMKPKSPRKKNRRPFLPPKKNIVALDSGGMVMFSR